MKTPEYWGGFDTTNPQHRYITSLLHQLGWTKRMSGRPFPVPDTKRLGEWLQSEKSPVRKALRKMNRLELSRIIVAMESMVQKKFKS